MLTVAIQAGGRSSRMGTDKGLVNLAGKPMIAHVLQKVSKLGDDLLITTNNGVNYEHLNVRLVADAEPGAGALEGLLTALQAATTEFVLVVACDMPFLNESLLAHLVDSRSNFDVIVPRWEGRLQPLHAVYRREDCITAIQAQLAANNKRVVSFFDDVRTHIIEENEVAEFDPQGQSFQNINTPQDLADAEKYF